MRDFEYNTLKPVLREYTRLVNLSNNRNRNADDEPFWYKALVLKDCLAALGWIVVFNKDKISMVYSAAHDRRSTRKW